MRKRVSVWLDQHTSVPSSVIEIESAAWHGFRISLAVSMRTRALPTALALLLTGCGGAGTSPTDLSGLCRIYSSSVTATTTKTPFTGVNPIVATEDITISYNIATNQLVASATGTSINGICRTAGSWSTNYGSIADFVEEVSVVPPRTRWVSQSGTVTQTGPDRPCGSGTIAATTTNSFDAQGRLVRAVSGGIPFPMLTERILIGTSVYTAWDVVGRPTIYSPPSPPASSVPQSIAYDDSARTRSTILNIGGISFSTTVDTFDSDGNLIRNRRVTRYPAPPITAATTGLPDFVETADTTFVIHATSRACR